MPTVHTAQYSGAQHTLPPEPCTSTDVDSAAIEIMENYGYLAFERGGTIICQSGSAVTAHLRDSFGDFYPPEDNGDYAPTEDPCALNIVETGAIGAFHSHPRFLNVNQLNRGNGCHGKKNYIAGDINPINAANANFTEPDPNATPPTLGDRSFGTKTGAPLYLLTPELNRIKKLEAHSWIVSEIWP